MKLYFRLIWLVLTQRFRTRSGWFGPCKTELRVWPNDLDIFMHMNNGVYLTMMDLGRTDMMLRSDIFAPIRKNGWYPVVAAETIRFQRSLTLFQKFDITTEVVGWDEKSIFIQQVFSSKGKQVAIAAINARFLSRKGERVTTDDLFQLLGAPKSRQPDLPEWIASWKHSTSAMPLENTAVT